MKELTNQFVQYNLLLTDHQDRRARIQDIVETQLTEMGPCVILKGSLTYRIFPQFFSNLRQWVGGSSSLTLRFDT